MDTPANSIFSGPVTHLLSMLHVLMKIHSHASEKKKKGLRVSDFALLLVILNGVMVANRLIVVYLHGIYPLHGSRDSSVAERPARD